MLPVLHGCRGIEKDGGRTDPVLLGSGCGDRQTETGRRPLVAEGDAGEHVADGGAELEAVAGEAGRDGHRADPVEDEILVGSAVVEAADRGRAGGVDARHPARDIGLKVRQPGRVYRPVAVVGVDGLVAALRESRLVLRSLEAELPLLIDLRGLPLGFPDDGETEFDLGRLDRGQEQPGDGVIQTRIGRSQSDRKKMAVLKTGGREAITHYRTERRFGGEKPLAARVACTLETGRTHQIRVHMASKGSPCLGDPTYGSGPPAAPVREAVAAAGLKRQALHAAVLGFVHPVTGQALRFESPLPPDMAQLEANLSAL